MARIALPLRSIRFWVVLLSLFGIGQANGKKKKDNGKTKDNIFDKKLGNIPDKFLKSIPKDVINAFKTRQGIKADWKLDYEMIDTYDNTIHFPESDIVVSLNNLEPYSLLASSGAANCYKEDVQIDCGDPTVFVGYDEPSGSRIQVNKNDDQVIESIILRRDNVQDGTIIKETLQAITGLGKKWKGGQLFASVPTEALDAKFYKQYSMESLEIPPNNDVRSLRYNKIHNEENIIIVQNVTAVDVSARPSRHRRLATCGTTFREVELAVAVDSTFCEQVGGTKNARPTVNRILADVTEEYEIDGLCWKVTMVHYEEHCNKDTDPFKNCFGGSCGNTIQCFRSFWNSNRKDVDEDAAQLFAGTSVGTGGVIGCAYVNGACTGSFEYGVTHMTYTTNAMEQSNLAAHELGHNVGASHINDNNSIMNPSNGKNDRTFSDTSINSFLKEGTNTCITPIDTSEAIPTFAPTKSPTIGPTQSPTIGPTTSPTPDCQDSDTWEFLSPAGILKDCSIVAKSPSYRCSKLGTDGIVASVACPVACGSCDRTSCHDDGTWTYGDLANKFCSHISIKPELRCSTKVGTDGRLASEACPVTCGTC